MSNATHDEMSNATHDALEVTIRLDGGKFLVTYPGVGQAPSTHDRYDEATAVAAAHAREWAAHNGCVYRVIDTRYDTTYEVDGRGITIEDIDAIVPETQVHRDFVIAHMADRLLGRPRTILTTGQIEASAQHHPARDRARSMRRIVAHYLEYRDGPFGARPREYYEAAIAEHTRVARTLESDRWASAVSEADRLAHQHYH